MQNSEVYRQLFCPVANAISKEKRLRLVIALILSALKRDNSKIFFFFFEIELKEEFEIELDFEASN